MRIKRGIVSHRKHQKLLHAVSGYRMTKRRLVKVAKEAYLHAGQYAFAGRRKKKSDFRRLWITRISEALSNQFGMSYSRFIAGLKIANIKINRKMFSILLNEDPSTFKLIVDKVKNV